MSSRDEYVAVLKEAFVTLGKKEAMDFLLAKLPVLAGKHSNKFLAFVGLHIANPLAAYVILLALEGITKGTEMAAFFLYIDMRVGKQGKEFEAAAYENYNAQRGNDPQRKANAEKNLKKRFREFVVLTN